MKKYLRLDLINVQLLLFMNCLSSQHHALQRFIGKYKCFSDTGNLPFLKIDTSNKHPIVYHKTSNTPHIVYHDKPSTMNDRTINFDILKKLDELYPNAIFILNTRSLNKWLISRFKHGMRKKQKPNWAWPCTAELTKKWINDRERYYFDILNYFEDKQDKLIIVSIEEENWIKYIANELSLRNFNIESQNIHETTDQHKSILDIVNETFEILNYDINDQDEIILHDKDLSKKYIQLYKNNIVSYNNYI